MRLERDGDRIVCLVIYFTADVDRHKTALRGAVNHKEMLRVDKARLSRQVALSLIQELSPVVAELVAAEQRGGRDARSWMVSPDPPHGVKIILPTGYEERRDALVRRYGDQVRVALEDITIRAIASDG
jgi:hypothetical protein